jgi:putative colanic acid biosynthesis UDP-glucose lipid carrier transferase
VHPESYKYLSFLSLLGDLVLLNAFFVAGHWFYAHPDPLTADRILFYVYLILVWLVLGTVFGLYEHKGNETYWQIITGYIKVIVFFFVLFLLYFQINTFNYYGRDTIKYLFPTYSAVLLLWNIGLNSVFQAHQRAHRSRQVLVIGQRDMATRLCAFFDQSLDEGYRCLGWVHTGTSEDIGCLGRFDNLPGFLEQNRIDEVFVIISDLNGTQRDLLAEWLDDHPVKVRMVTDFGKLYYHSIEMQQWGDVPVLTLHPGPLGIWYNQLIKRAFDLLFSILVILLVLSWLTLLVYVLDRILDRKGVFFTQDRTSLNGKTFRIIKYQSMRPNEEADTRQAVEGDARITRMGGFMRRTSLDELPQFINVFLGNMSVVGPRPHMLAHTAAYRKQVKGYMHRHLVKPGLTGLAQVRGYRGEVREVGDIEKRVALDMAYIRNWSFWLDVRLIFATVWMVIRQLMRLPVQKHPSA